MTPPDRFETVAYVYCQSELAALLSLFEQEDIWVVPIGRGHAALQWDMTVALGGVALRVHYLDADRTRALLATLDRSNFWRPIFSQNRLIEIAVILLLFVAGFFAPPARISAVFVLDRAAAIRRSD